MDWILQTTQRIFSSQHTLANVLSRLNLLLWVLVSLVLLVNFSVWRLTVILSYAFVYYGLLIYLDNKNQDILFYLIGFSGALYALPTVYVWTLV